MKNVFVFFVFIFVATICSSQIKLEGDSEGNYRVKEETQDWTPSETTVESEAIKYIDSFSQAIQSPGTPILVEQGEKVTKLKLVFKKLVEIEQHFIVYRVDSDKIYYFVRMEKKEEPSYLILFSIVSIILMIISNILHNKGKDGLALAALAALAAAFAFAFAFALAFAFVLAALAAVFAAFAAAFALAAFVLAADKNYKVASIIFYILMAVHIILLFV